MIDVRIQDGDTVTFGVFLQGFGVIETHGLLIEYGNVKLQWVVILEPGHVVGGCAKGKGMGLREHVVTVELFEDPLCCIFRNAQLGGPVPELRPIVANHEFIVAPPKGPAHLVSLQSCEAGHVDGYLVHLVLEQDYSQGPLQGPLLQRMVIVPGDTLRAALDELGDTVVHSHTGTHRTHLVGHISQVLGFDARHGLHLSSRLHLKDANGVSPVHGFVDCSVVEIDTTQVDVLAPPLFD